MKKLSSTLTVIFFALQFSVAQSPPPALLTGWERVYIKNVGSFDLPPTMEIQKGKYKEFTDEITKIKGFDATQLIAQQKGLNELGKEGFEKYARVMVETTLSSAGDFEKLNFNTAKYTQTDISKLNSTYRQQIEQGFLGTGLELVEWYPLKLENINGMSCIHISYKRQLQDKPFVL